MSQALAMMTKAGFVVDEHYDFMEVGKELYGDDEFPWWGDLLEGNHHGYIVRSHHSTLPQAHSHDPRPSICDPSALPPPQIPPSGS